MTASQLPAVGQPKDSQGRFTREVALDAITPVFLAAQGTVVYRVGGTLHATYAAAQRHARNRKAAFRRYVAATSA